MRGKLNANEFEMDFNNVITNGENVVERNLNSTKLLKNKE